MDMNKKFDEIISFSEKEFSTESYKCDFRYLQPKVYLHPEKNMDAHRLFYREGKLAGLYCLYDTAYRGLKLQGIGTVCVNKEYRNLGIMKEMMLDALEKTDADILYLSGDRKRYERYGFYICGKKIIFRIKPNKDIKLAELKEYKENDIEINRQLYSLYSKQNNSLERDFTIYYDILRTHGYKPYLIINNDKIEGYISYNQANNRIVEIVAANELIEPAVNALAFLNKTKDIYVEVGIDSKYKVTLMRMAQKYGVESITNIRLINPCRVIEKLLSNKPDLLDGELILPRINTEKNIRISVKNGIVQASLCSLEPTLALSMEDIYLLLFSNYLDYYDAKFNFISSWFPLDLPASITAVDSI